MVFPAEIISPVTRQLLEGMYFCEPRYMGPARLRSPLLGASLTFRGAFAGEVRVLATHRLAAQLAAEFLVSNPADITPLQVQATVAELANVVCGAALNAWPPMGDFHFSTPVKAASDQSGVEFAHCFSVGNGPAELAIEIRIRLPAAEVALPALACAQPE